MPASLLRRRDREHQGGEIQCSARPVASKNQRTKALWRGFYVFERAMVITDLFSSCIPKWWRRESYRWILLICPLSDWHEFGSDVSGWDGHYTSHIENCGTLLGKFKLEDQRSGKSTSNWAGLCSLCIYHSFINLTLSFGLLALTFQTYWRVRHSQLSWVWSLNASFF